MPAVITMLKQVLRHVALGMAILAVLVPVLRVHGHDRAPADVAQTAGCAHDPAPADPVEPQPCDPDGCGHCHCSSVNVVAPDAASLPCAAAMVTLERRLHPVVIPDRLSYPPDPPPVRLS